LIRTSGPDRSILYGLRWIGDKETFSSDTVVALPLRIPVVIRVSVSPPGMGVHSAILNVADRETGLTLHRVLATIVAAPPLDARNGFVIRSTGQVSRPGSRSEFVRVPAHTSVLELAALARDGFLKVQICDPTGRYVPEGELEWLDFQYLQAGRELRRAIENPMPGVWEIVILNDRDLFRLDQNAPFPLSSNAYELTIRAISARLDSRSDSPIAINEMAPIETRIVSSPLAVLQNKKPAVTRNASQRLFEVVIPRQSGTLVVNLANVSDLSADLDLYLFDCTSGYCVLRGSRVDPCPIQSLTVHRPAAGTWKVVLDGFSLPSGNAHADLNEIATTKPANYFRMGKAGVKARLVEVLGDSVTSFETRRKVGRPPALPGEAEDVELVTWNVPLARALVVPSIR